MIKIKNKAFTLSEVLITLAVVGTLAALVVPGLIKDYNSKANMTMLQNMVANLQSAVQTQMTREGATDLDATDIVKDPEKFFRTLDVVNASSDAKYFPNLNNYKILSGAALTAIPKTCKASAKMKNGVALCMSTFAPVMGNAYGTTHRNVATIYIDLNGVKEPNISGVDFFAVYIYPVTTLNGTIPTHPGDIAGVSITTPAGKSCNTNSDFSPIGCYSQAEQSGFDPNYWKKLL
mgnify:CR=1 FL=1